MRSILAVVVLASFVDQVGRASACSAGGGAPGGLKCQNCAQSLVTVTMNGVGSHGFQSITLNRMGGAGNCATLTLACAGNDATIEFNQGNNGVVGDNGSGTARSTLVCNTAGTAWQLDGVDITTIECSSA